MGGENYMSLPYRNIITIDRNLRTPLYLQVSTSIIKNIVRGIIAPGHRLPGARSLSGLLKVSRRTIMQAYDELEAQGWIEVMPSKGTYVQSKIPVRKNVPLSLDRPPKKHSKIKWSNKLDFLDHFSALEDSEYNFLIDTGYPDVRLAPLKELSQAMSRVINSRLTPKLMNYSSAFRGHPWLISEFRNYLSESRGIHVDTDSIMITRGSLMAFHCIYQVLLDRDDIVVMGDVSFEVAKKIARIAGGNIMTVSVDKDGINVDELEQICKTTKVKSVFVMPHHHHPTTVSLSAERRVKLLMLSYEYGFSIIEDDYDYDFHYDSGPLLPMASVDNQGHVIYVGSLSKTVAPSLRLGFVVAAPSIIRQLERVSRYIDCHGNVGLEKAIAHLFREGIIRRHLKKSLKMYHRRRDRFCRLLEENIGSQINYTKPDGGLALWTEFNDSINLNTLRKNCLSEKLLIPRTTFSDAQGKCINGLRMGFASMNDTEMDHAVNILKRSIVG